MDTLQKVFRSVLIMALALPWSCTDHPVPEQTYCEKLLTACTRGWQPDSLTVHLATPTKSLLGPSCLRIKLKPDHTVLADWSGCGGEVRNLGNWSCEGCSASACPNPFTLYLPTIDGLNPNALSLEAIQGPQRPVVLLTPTRFEISWSSRFGLVTESYICP